MAEKWYSTIAYKTGLRCAIRRHSTPPLCTVDAIDPVYIYTEAEHAEVERMKAFVVAVMSAWPIGEIDAADLQELGIEHGLLKLQEPSPTKPCSDGCTCAKYLYEKEFADGLVRCYRKTYTGEQP